jgi:hypothetical protein
VSVHPQIIHKSHADKGTVATLADLQRQINTLKANMNSIPAGGVSGGQIAGGTITNGNIQAGTITATEIAAGTITAAQITAGTITASLIAAGTIVASNIAANTITGNNIAANTITGANIATGTLTGGLIAAGTITGNNILAGSITASALSVTSLSSVSANMGTVTGGIFQTGNTGARVMMGTGMTTPSGVTAGIVGIDGSNNVTFSIDATTGNVVLKGTLQQGSNGLGNIGGVTQNAVLQVAGNNLIDNPSGTTNTTNTAVFGGTVALDATTYLTAPSGFKITASAANNGLGFQKAGAAVPVTVGLPYSARCFVFSAVARQFVVQFVTNTSTVTSATFSVPAGQWTRLYMENYVVPSGVTSITPYVAMPTGGNGVAGDVWYVDEMMFVQQPSAQGAMVLANSITATEISVGSLSAVSANLGTVTSGTLNSATITSATITAGSISSSTVTGSTVQDVATNPKTALDSTGVFVTDSAGNKLFTMNETTGLKLSTPAGAFAIGDISWYDTTVNGPQVAEVLGFKVSSTRTFYRAQAINLNNSLHSSYLQISCDTSVDTDNFFATQVWNAAGTTNYNPTLIRGDGASSFASFSYSGTYGISNPNHACFFLHGATIPSGSNGGSFTLSCPGAASTGQTADVWCTLGTQFSAFVPTIATYVNNGNGTMTVYYWTYNLANTATPINFQVTGLMWHG